MMELNSSLNTVCAAKGGKPVGIRLITGELVIGAFVKVAGEIIVINDGEAYNRNFIAQNVVEISFLEETGG